MTARSQGATAPSTTSDHAESQHSWPRDFGRDGVSGLVSPERALRARDVSRPDSDDVAYAESVLEELLARVEGTRPRPTSRPKRPTPSYR